MRKTPQIVPYNRNEIKKSIIFLDYYSLLLPSFFFFLSMTTLMLIRHFLNNFLYHFFITINSLSILLLIYFLVLKTYYDSHSYYSLKMATDVFNNYLDEHESRKKKFYVKKFSYYFIKAVNNIDRDLAKNLKVRNLEHENTLPIKPVIKKYLNTYLLYCKENEIKDFKHTLESIFNSIDIENQIIHLEVTKHIFEVYVGIKDFFVKRNYKIHVSKISRYFDFNLSFHSFLLIFLFSSIALFGLQNIIVEDLYKLIEIFNNQIGNMSPSDRLNISWNVLQILYVLTIFIAKAIQNLTE